MISSFFDPESVPIDVVAGEPRLDSGRQTRAWLRQRFANPVPWQPEITDESRFTAANGKIMGDKVINASVLIVIIERESGMSVLLTRRTAHLKAHAGQISFPGGRSEPEDSSPIETALREAREEIGLGPERVDVLGTLPDYLTATGYRVTPVVSVIRSTAQSPLQLTAQVEEVAEIFEVPLDFLMDGQSHQLRSRFLSMGADRSPVKRSFYAMPYKQYFIWGATAGMVRNLFHFLRA